MTAYPVDMTAHPQVEPFLDLPTNTISYIVSDPATGACAIVDPVMDFDYDSGRTSFGGADKLIAAVRERGLTVEWIIETHVHADHLTAAPYIREQLGGRIAIGENVLTVQKTFAGIFNEGPDFPCDGSQFDRLLSDGDTYTVGSIPAVAMYTPGHTPACMTHFIGDAGFVGDTLFMPDAGSARADFPGGDAGTLYDSMQKILALPDDMRLFMCHDYGPNGREIAWETTVGTERAENIHVGEGISRDAFIAMRTARDATLAVPHLILPSLQVNMRAGALPTDADGQPMLKLPLNKL